MVMFRTGQARFSAGNDSFTDLLFNALLTFTFLFLISLLLINPPAKSGIIDPKAEFLITVSWEDGSANDIDTWVEGPQGTLVWYKQTQNGLMHLDRDDRIVNVHYYKSENQLEVPVTVYVAEVNPTLKVLHYASLNLKQEGDEKTAVRLDFASATCAFSSWDLLGSLHGLGSFSGLAQ